MKKTVKLFIIICLYLVTVVSIHAQSSKELEEAKVANYQVYRELLIQIIAIDRVREWEPELLIHNPALEELRSKRKMVTEQGFEIAVVRIRTQRLGESPGIWINRFSLYDTEGKEYISSMQRFIGTNRSRFDDEIHEYEYPVTIPIGLKITKVQIITDIYSGQEGVQNQKLLFNIDSLN